jgi:hypothetical protein
MDKALREILKRKDDIIFEELQRLVRDEKADYPPIEELAKERRNMVPSIPEGMYYADLPKIDPSEG